MSKPIKETPILKGKDAARFIKKMNEAITQKIGPVTMARMRENFAKLQAIARFK